MQIPNYVIVVTPYSRNVSLATIGVCVFCASASVGALFYFRTFLFFGGMLMKLSEKSIRIVSAITVIIEIILAVCLIANCYEHYMTNNVWVEEDDKILSPIITVVVVVAFVVIPFTVLNMVLKAKSNKVVKPKLDISAIKKRCSTNIFSHIGLIFLLYIISEKVARNIVIELFSLDLSEATYMAGHYGIFRSSFLVMLLVLIASDLVTICIANKLLPSNEGEHDSILVDDSQNNNVDMKTEIEIKRRVIKKFWIIYAAILISALLVVFFLLWRMTTPSIDIDRFIGNM